MYAVLKNDTYAMKYVEAPATRAPHRCRVLATEPAVRDVEGVGILT